MMTFMDEFTPTIKRKGRRKRPIFDNEDSGAANKHAGLVPDVIAPSPDSNHTATEPIQEFLNKENSWLEFNKRVLHEAIDKRTPLLERVKFLGIFNSNLDEFFMKRIGGIKRQISAGITRRNIDLLTPQEVITSARRKILPLLEKLADLYVTELRPALATNGIHLVQWKNLTDTERYRANKYFRENIFPVLTPLAVDPGHPFPFQIFLFHLV
jgi:polyphosphate kinase